MDELLNSLTRQTNKNFEVLVVEDGSSVPCKEVVDNYADRLDICYYFKSNSGPGQTRNYGAERGHGEYLIILDSDCILPEGYLAAVESELQQQKADAFGGPDRAHDSFTNIQKAINYAMTSLFYYRRYPWREEKKWINSIPVVSIWGYVGRCMKPWEDSQRCVSARILISASVFFKGGYTCRHFSGCLGISQAPDRLEANSSNKCTTPVLPVSIFTRSTLIR